MIQGVAIAAMASTAQLRAGRSLLGWSQFDLAAAAKVSRATVARAELSEVSPAAVAALRKALEKAGVIFVESNGDGPGVRLRKKLEKSPRGRQS